MCRALIEHGLDAMIATTDADGPGRLPVERERCFVYEGVPTIVFSRQASEAFKYSRPLARWLYADVADFDVVHIHAVFSHSSLTAARACRRHGVPYVVRPLGSLDPWSLSQKRLRKHFLWHCGVWEALRSAAAVHYTTLVERQRTEDALGVAGGAVIPLGIDGEWLQRRGTDDAGALDRNSGRFGDGPYVLALCRMHPVKGLDVLVRAFLDLRGVDEWQLVVAGDGERKHVAALQRFVADRGGQDRVLFAGWLDGAERTAVLRQASLLAMPSRYESFGLSLLEAMACGVPVLASSHVGLAEEIRQAGAGWVVDLSPDAIRGALEEAVSGEGERAVRGEAGLNLVRSRFTWPLVAEQLTALYRGVAGGSP